VSLFQEPRENHTDIRGWITTTLRLRIQALRLGTIQPTISPDLIWVNLPISIMC